MKLSQNIVSIHKINKYVDANSINKFLPFGNSLSIIALKISEQQVYAKKNFKPKDLIENVQR